MLILSPVTLARLYRPPLPVCLFIFMTLPSLLAGATSPQADSAVQTPLPVAQKATTEVQALLDQGKAARVAGNLQEAAALYEQALTKARTFSDLKGETEALRGRGNIYRDTGDQQKALERYQQALTVAQAIKNRDGEANALDNIGGVYNDLGQPQKALEYHQPALPIYRNLGDKEGEASALVNIGVAYDGVGQPQKALEYYQQALPICRAAGNKLYEANALYNIGIIYQETGQNQKALKYYRQALPIYRAIGNKRLEANVLISLGLIYQRTGQNQKALEYYQQALPIYRVIGDKNGEANALDNIGVVYNDIGQPQKALEYHQQALVICRDVGDKDSEAGTLVNIGNVYSAIWQPQKALEYYQQALPLCRDTGNKQFEANALTCLGGAYNNIGQPPKALKYYQQALPIYRTIGDKNGEAGALVNIGGVYNDIGQPQKALKYYRQAQSACGQDDKHLRADILYARSLVENKLHQSAPALAHARQSVSVLEELRAGLGGYSESKTALLADKLYYYDHCLDLLLQNQRTAEAFAMAQKTKGRALLDLLASGKIALDGALTADEKQELQDLRVQADALNQQMVKEGVQNEVGSKQRFAALQKEQREVEGKLQTLTDTLYARHPGLADKQIATTATLSSLASVLPVDTALLDYIQLSNKKLLLFVVTAQHGKARVRVYPISVTAARLQQECTAFRAACADPRKDYRLPASKLARLLISPALGSVNL